MRLCSSFLVAFSLLLAVPRGVAAQSPQADTSVAVPRLINVSGVFQPADGQPPAQAEVVILSIYAAPDGGLPVWQERQSVTVDKSGRFTLLLGASYPDGIPARRVRLGPGAVDEHAVRAGRRSGASARADCERALCTEGVGCRDARRAAGVGVSARADGRADARRRPRVVARGTRRRTRPSRRMCCRGRQISSPSM